MPSLSLFSDQYHDVEHWSVILPLYTLLNNLQIVFYIFTGYCLKMIPPLHIITLVFGLPLNNYKQKSKYHESHSNPAKIYRIKNKSTANLFCVLLQFPPLVNNLREFDSRKSFVEGRPLRALLCGYMKSVAPVIELWNKNGDFDQHVVLELIKNHSKI